MRRFLAILLISLWSASSLFATVVVPLSFEQLVNESQSVVYGRVSGVRAQWTTDRRFIESVVTVEILRGMKGSSRESIVFAIPGGQVGTYLNVIPGAPTLVPGDLAVFFVTAQGARMPVTTGLTQGIYRVRRDAASGEMQVVPPIVETGRIVRGDVKRKPVSLAAFEGTVRAVASR
ncbi:MAG: hypothetical protein K2Y23_20185 [Cyanobacteria bacterium]|nr:hypothetical protein [Cyanobacteriota bacterium]